MKNILLVFILAITLFGCIAWQEPKQYADYSANSGFTAPAADSADVDNLVVLAKVWGFVKYHHPTFAHEDCNADCELFELLPQIAYADKEERNSVLVQWIEGLGMFESAENTYQSWTARNNYTLAADLAWLDDEELLGTKLSGQPCFQVWVCSIPTARIPSAPASASTTPSNRRSKASGPDATNCSKKHSNWSKNKRYFFVPPGT